MSLRVAFRFIGGLVVATALIVTLLAVLSPIRRAGAAPLAGQDHVSAVKRAVEAPADEAAGGSPTPRIVLVFAGIVLLAVLPPVHRVHVHHRSYQRFDWI